MFYTVLKAQRLSNCLIRAIYGEWRPFLPSWVSKNLVVVALSLTAPFESTVNRKRTTGANPFLSCRWSQAYGERRKQAWHDPEFLG
jgi:hypothetical protein